MIYFYYVLLAVFSYFFGNLNFAIIISKHLNKDITKMGSGNPGSMNMVRHFGIKYGFLTLVLDTIKGVIPALVGLLCIGEIGLYVGGCFVVIGHIFPVFYKFKGGKGIASSLGVFWVANPILATIMFFVMLLAIYLIKYGSIASLGYMLVMTVVELILVKPANWVNYIFISVIFLLVIYAHRTNIKRLFQGTEAKTEFKRTKDINKSKDISAEPKSINKKDDK